MQSDRKPCERRWSSWSMRVFLARRIVALAMWGLVLGWSNVLGCSTALGAEGEAPAVNRSPPVGQAMRREETAARRATPSPLLKPPSEHFRSHRPGERRALAWPTLPTRFDPRILVFIGLAGAWLWWQTQRAARQRWVVPPGAVEICGRVPLDNKQSLHFVRIGQRILVLLQSAQGVQRVTEITEPEEVRNLLESSGAIDRAAASVGGGSEKSLGSALGSRLESWS